MKKASALALIEFGDISAGIYAVDALLKKAPIAFIRSGTVSRGRYLVVIGGSPAAVEESYRAGLQAATRSITCCWPTSIPGSTRPSSPGGGPPAKGRSRCLKPTPRRSASGRRKPP